MARSLRNKNLLIIVGQPPGKFIKCLELTRIHAYFILPIFKWLYTRGFYSMRENVIDMIFWAVAGLGLHSALIQNDQGPLVSLMFGNCAGEGDRTLYLPLTMP